jgi:hypothetical protein
VGQGRRQSNKRLHEVFSVMCRRCRPSFSRSSPMTLQETSSRCRIPSGSCSSVLMKHRLRVSVHSCAGRFMHQPTPCSLSVVTLAGHCTPARASAPRHSRSLLLFRSSSCSPAGAAARALTICQQHRAIQRLLGTSESAVAEVKCHCILRAPAFSRLQAEGVCCCLGRPLTAAL